MPIAHAFDHFDDVHRWHVRCSFTSRVETPKERNAMKLRAMLAGATVGVLLAGLAVAQGPATPRPQPSMTRPETYMSARHTMTGEVTSVTPEKGRILVTTPEGRMLLHFPSSALQNVKKGDSVTVELALKDNDPAQKTK
jgi:hypothetical protein